MLRNECYTGRYTKNNETFTNMFPRIITDEIYNKVKAKHKTNRYGKVSVMVPKAGALAHLLSIV